MPVPCSPGAPGKCPANHSAGTDCARFAHTGPWGGHSRPAAGCLPQELGDDINDPVGMGRAAGDVDGGLAGDGLDAFYPGGVGARGGDAAEGGAGADAENLGRLGREIGHRLLEGDIMPVIGPGPTGPASEGCGHPALHGQDIAAGAVGLFRYRRGGLAGRGHEVRVIEQIDVVEENIAGISGISAGSLVDEIEEGHGAAGTAAALQPDYLGPGWGWPGPPPGARGQGCSTPGPQRKGHST